MPVFEYKGLTIEGKNVKGFIDADSLQNAKNKLRQSGIYPVEVVEEIGRRYERGIRYNPLRRINKQEIAIFTRQLATLLLAGLPLMEALTASIDHIDDPQLKKTIIKVRENVKEGKSLAESMGEFPRVFSSLYINMVQAGEASGALDIVLARLADFQEGQIKLRNKIWATLTYPILMLFIGIGVLAFLFTFVIPQVTKVFEDTGQVLPLPTIILINISSFLSSYWWLIGVGLIGVAIGIIKYIKTPTGRALYDRWILNLPLFGKIVKLIAISRFARTLSTLLTSSVPLIISMDIVKTVVANTFISRALEQVKEDIREGASLSEALKKTKIFPSMVIQMTMAGEKSGQLEDMLKKVADIYDNEIDTTVAGLTSLLEPVMILIMGVIVLFVVLSILLPIFEMSEIIH